MNQIIKPVYGIISLTSNIDTEFTTQESYTSNSHFTILFKAIPFKSMNFTL